MSHTHSLFTLDAAGTPIAASPDEIIAVAREQISHRLRRGSPLSSAACSSTTATGVSGGAETVEFGRFQNRRHKSCWRLYGQTSNHLFGVNLTAWNPLGDLVTGIRTNKTIKVIS